MTDIVGTSVPRVDATDKVTGAAKLADDFQFGPGLLYGRLVRSPHPLWIIYGVVLAAVGASFLVPAWAVTRAGRGLRFVEALIERLGLLAMFYLVFDVAALVIVVIRNL